MKTIILLAQVVMAGDPVNHSSYTVSVRWPFTASLVCPVGFSKCVWRVTTFYMDGALSDRWEPESLDHSEWRECIAYKACPGPNRKPGVGSCFASYVTCPPEPDDFVGGRK